MTHIPAIAGRELRSLFSSPVAYVVLVLFAVLAGVFFLVHVLNFSEFIRQSQQFGIQENLERANLNDFVIAPFLQTMSVVLLFLIPGLTMGVIASEKTNGTQELLLTSPITIWELVLGKFVASLVFVAILVFLLGLFPAILIYFGNPELGKIGSGLLGLFALGTSYAAIGTFASSVTRSQLIAYFLSVVVLLVLLLLGLVASEGVGVEWATGFLRYLGTVDHFENLVMGLVDTRHLAYFAVMTAIPLILAKAAIESVRWR